MSDAPLGGQVEAATIQKRSSSCRGTSGHGADQSGTISADHTGGAIGTASLVHCAIAKLFHQDRAC